MNDCFPFLCWRRTKRMEWRWIFPHPAECYTCILDARWSFTVAVNRSKPSQFDKWIHFPDLLSNSIWRTFAKRHLTIVFCNHTVFMQQCCNCVKSIQRWRASKEMRPNQNSIVETHASRHRRQQVTYVNDTSKWKGRESWNVWNEMVTRWGLLHSTVPQQWQPTPEQARN